MNSCKRIQKWIQENPGRDYPEWVKTHIASCKECKAVAVTEQLLLSLPVEETTGELSFTPQYDWKIQNAIHTVAEQKKQGSVYKRLHIKAWITTAAVTCAFVIAFFVIPFANSQSMYALIMNEKFKEQIAFQDSSMVFSVNPEIEKEQLQFANTFCESNEDRQFLFSNNESSRNTLLFVKYLASKSDMLYSQIYQYAQEDQYVKAIHYAGLPLYQTWRDFSSYLDSFILLPGQPFESFDATVLSFDYGTGKVVLDSSDQNFYCDFITMQQLYPFTSYHFTVKITDGKSYITALDKPYSQDKMLFGEVQKTNTDTIRISTFDGELFISQKVIQNNKLLDFLQPGDYIFARITELESKQWVALSLKKIDAPVERQMTGTIQSVYKNGYMLEDLSVSFSFEMNLQRAIQEDDIVTFNGTDFGQFFITDSFLSIVSPPKQEHEYYIAVAPADQEPNNRTTTQRAQQENPPKKQTREPEKAFLGASSDKQPESDIVVGSDQDNYYLLSGKTILRNTITTSLSVGESLRYVAMGHSLDIQSHFSNKPHVMQCPVTVLETLSNGVVILHCPQDGSRIYLYSNQPISADVSMFQGKVVSYGSMNIALEWRTFSFSTLVNIQGMVTRELEKNSLYQLDNGYILRIDDLTELQGQIKIGRTVKISGLLEQGILRGYIVSVEKEMILMGGAIVDWNEEQQWLMLDNGVIIHITDATVFYGQGSLEIGVTVYCKVYVKDGNYFASDIAWEDNTIPGSGERI